MRAIFLFFLFINNPMWAQVQNDFNHFFDFADSQWIGATDDFMINPQFQLQLNAPPLSGERCLFHPSRSMINGIWSCDIQLNFNPSSQNYCRIYLATDQPDPDQMTQAIYVSVGEKNDEISLYQMRSGVITRLIDGNDNRLSAERNQITIQVISDSAGKWTLYSSHSGILFKEGDCDGVSPIESEWFGLYCKYTSTRSTGFAFDNLQVTGDPYQRKKGHRFDVVITEFMTDPTPSYGLPETEYIEFFNRTEEAVNVSGWKLMANHLSYELTPGWILPHSYVVLVPQSQLDQWQGPWPVLPMKSFPSLAKEQGELWISDESGMIMDAIRYNKQWMDLSFKQEGGWSFEIRDVNNRSGSAGNWIYSDALLGGSPGSENSCAVNYPDTEAPRIHMLEVIDSTTLAIMFSEGIGHLSTWHEKDLHIACSNIAILSVDADTVFRDRVLISFNQPMTNRQICSMNLSGEWKDEAGNALVMDYPLMFGRVEMADSLDVVINEVLFHPASGGIEFIELYNRSDKIVSLHDLYLGKRSGVHYTSMVSISSHRTLFFPHTYHVLTPDTAALKSVYPQLELTECSEVSSFPALDNEGGEVAIMTLAGNCIDKVNYSVSWHHPLLRQVEGVSLERIHPGFSSQSPQSWHSASSASGYASPGRENSQYFNNNHLDEEMVSITPKLFTPDLDGHDDYLNIGIHGQSPEGAVTIDVYDADCRFICRIANNALVGNQTAFVWDGTDEGGHRVIPGIYVVYCRVFFLSGQVKEFRKTCMVGVTQL